ncbi:hypothetical protein CHRY9293_02775 [Chryseobacterium potabilaquae]|uniref:Uncharacterized protein n=1 Tax=Chryseobacterium potabilaquae TaxID=2675057 RepID=A0A6N4XDN0_9FLAO|nr:hypothetical protein CHRY9293_02775 [Chryseobacterium potabilaquae]
MKVLKQVLGIDVAKDDSGKFRKIAGRFEY